MSMCHLIGALKYERGVKFGKGYTIALGPFRAQGALKGPGPRPLKGPSGALKRARAQALKRARVHALKRAQGGP